MPEISFTVPDVGFSITNPKVERAEALDTLEPFSFLDFITYTKVDYTPEEYSQFYTAYIKQWYSTKDLSQQEQENEFKTFYTNFIKDIVLNFTTESERRFLSKIDYSSSTDLDIVLPFYANKIREIVIFYKNKRNEGKYVIDRNKIKGSTTGVERALFDNIYNTLFNTQNTLSTVSLSALTSKLDIDIEEYIDVYGDYFDLPRTSNDEVDLRRELYSSNINNIDPKYYFDPSALNTITNNFLLSTIPSFYINPPADVTVIDPVCDPNNDILRESERTTSGFTPAEIYNLKRQLISKYCGADFYYTDTRESTVVTNILFRAENPTNNILNLQTADTATIESNQIRLLKDIGLFFKPNNLSIFKLTADKSTYEVDPNKLESGKVYIYPDPNIYGNVSVNPQSAYPISFKFDYRDGIRNISSGLAANDPYITNQHQTYTGYTSKESQSNNLIFRNENGLKFNFSDLYNQGLLAKVQYDIYGNEYGLFKTDSLAQIQDVDGYNILDLLLDGHTFFDPIEGYNFDYSTVSRDDTTVRSGLSTFTNGFSSLEGFLTIYFREFTPYQDFTVSSTRNIIPRYRDGGQFTFISGKPLPDPLSSTDINWPGPYNYYYAILANGTPGSIPEDFTIDTRYNLSASDYFSYDCGYFTDDLSIPNDFNYTNSFRYIDAVDSRSITQVSTLTASSIPTQAERKALAGKLYVKNQRFSLSYPLSTALASTLAKYSQSIRDDINTNIVDFDIIRDVIILKTPSTLIIEKISYNNGAFAATNTTNTVYSILSSDPYTKISNRFFNEKESKVYFTITEALSVSCDDPRHSPKNSWRLVPGIYDYDIATGISNKLFPTFEATLTTELSGFNLSRVSEEYDFAPASIKTPTITYNSTNDIYKVTYIITDTNHQTHICDASFTRVNNRMNLINVSIYNTDGVARSTTFNESFSTFFAKISSTSGSFYINENDNTLII